MIKLGCLWHGLLDSFSKIRQIINMVNIEKNLLEALYIENLGYNGTSKIKVIAL